MCLCIQPSNIYTHTHFISHKSCILDNKNFTYLIWLSNTKILFSPKHQNQSALLSRAYENENTPMSSPILGIICIPNSYQCLQCKIVNAFNVHLFDDNLFICFLAFTGFLFFIWTHIFLFGILSFGICW